MKLMEHRYGAKDFLTSKDYSLLTPGTYYLTEVDSKYCRFYAVKGVDGTCENGCDQLSLIIKNREKFVANLAI